MLLTFSLFAQGVAPIHPEGAGTVEDPFRIANLANLRWLSENDTYEAWGYWDDDSPFSSVSRHYIQTANIDATETLTWNEGAGFKPIGMIRWNSNNGSVNYRNSFHGSYNGNNFIITNLFINQPRETGLQKPTGMFGDARMSTISNVHLVNVNIVPTFSTGALLGLSMGNEIINCSSSGSISGNVAGMLNGGLAPVIGGLIGSSQPIAGIKSNIQSCFSYVDLDITGSISGVGGLVAFLADSDISDSFFYGSIRALNALGAGGLVGIADFEGGSQSSIRRSYVSSKKPLELSGTRGAIVGFGNIASAEANYWDREATGINTPDQSGIFGRTTSQMMQQSNYVDWDFTDTWSISLDINSGYPTIRGSYIYHVPFAVRLLTPENNATDVSRTPTLAWQYCEIADLPVLYQILISTNQDISNPIVIQTASHPTTTLTVTTALENDKKYFWKVIPMNEYGSPENNKIWTFTTEEYIDTDDETVLPTTTNLLSNFPNPFNPETTIEFSLSFGEGRGEGSINVHIEVYNIRGQRIKTLVNDHFPVGRHSVVWNGTDDNGRSVSSGIYLYRMTAGSYQSVRRMLLIK